MTNYYLPAQWRRPVAAPRRMPKPTNIFFCYIPLQSLVHYLLSTTNRRPGLQAIFYSYSRDLKWQSGYVCGPNDMTCNISFQLRSGQISLNFYPSPQCTKMCFLSYNLSVLWSIFVSARKMMSHPSIFA